MGYRTLRTPSLALALALAILLAPTALVSLARADVITPFLTGTEPDSPGASTEPLLHGRVGGVGTSAAALSGPRLGPVGAATEPSATVTIYTDQACLGPVEASGTVAALEGPGIQVSVTPGSTSTFYATVTEGSETSACSGGLVYRHVTAPPPMPTLNSVLPASPADDNLPRLLGSAEPESTVWIFTDSGCAGAALASGTGEAFGNGGIPVAVANNSITTFYATASWAGFVSACSETSLTYQEVTVAPPPPPPPPAEPGPVEGEGAGTSAPIPGRPAPPKLHTVPGGRANDETPLVAGAAPGAVRVIIYSGDGCGGGVVAAGSSGELATGIPVRVVANAATSFFGVAIAADGDRSRCSPDPAIYVEDSTPPLTRITFGPGVKTRKRSPVFRFADISGDPPGTTFLCKLDRRPWRACQSPWRLSGVRPSAHLVRVKAIDGAGNQEPVGAKRRFKVIAPARR